MIAVGHRFNIGARAVLTAPVDKDSVMVLAQYGDQFVTGRVYVRQLPAPEEWHNGNYHHDLTSAVEDWAERAGLIHHEKAVVDQSRIKHMVALAQACTTRIEEGAHA